MSNPSTTIAKTAVRKSPRKASRKGTRTLPSRSTGRKAESKRPVTHAEIRNLAYLIYVNEGQPHGRHEQHWFEAEAQFSGAGSGL